LLCCRPFEWVARRDARPWHRESRSPCFGLRARRPPFTCPACSWSVRHLPRWSEPTNENRPTRPVARVGRRCRSPVAEGVTPSRRPPPRNSHAGAPSLLPAPVPWQPDAAASAVGPRAEVALEARERTHVGTPATGARGPRHGRRDGRVLPRVACEPVERACLHWCVSSVRVAGWAGRTRRKRKIAPPMSSRSSWLRGPLRARRVARGRGGLWNIGTRLP
jgi:hypothetical protein